MTSTPGQEPTNARDPPGSFFVGEPSAQQPEESAEGGSRQGQPEKDQSRGVPGSVGKEQQPFKIRPKKGEGKPARQGVFHFFGHGITPFLLKNEGSGIIIPGKGGKVKGRESPGEALPPPAQGSLWPVLHRQPLPHS